MLQHRSRSLRSLLEAWIDLRDVIKVPDELLRVLPRVYYVCHCFQINEFRFYAFVLRLGGVGSAVFYSYAGDLFVRFGSKNAGLYSAEELENLIEATNKVCAVQSRKSPALVLLKQKAAPATAVSA